jgi:hypothetical protein
MSLKKELGVILKQYQDKYPPSLFKDKEFYGEWLAQTYFFVRHSTSLLGYAMPHLKNDGLRHHFEHHLGEEERHDLLAIKDLERIGKNISQYEEYTSTQAFYQSQYYRISFEGGTSLLGYILFLEGLAVAWGRPVYEEIKDLYKGAALFLKVHAEEDPDHLDAAISTILKLSPEEQKMIVKNLHYSHEMYESILQCALKKKEAKKVA